MLLAKDLIIREKLKIKELAFTYGSSANASKFSKAFIKHIGNPPSHYKKE